jgi:murein DD-endopeptidase MepM/ murein hydrolase activator NlpD
MLIYNGIVRTFFPIEYIFKHSQKHLNLFPIESLANSSSFVRLKKEDDVNLAVVYFCCFRLKFMAPPHSIPMKTIDRFATAPLLHWFKPRWWFSLLVGAIALMSVLSQPAQAFQAQIQPPNPQLGDTVSVIVQANSGLAENPTVTVREKNYATFPIGGDRYRALVPTTPLDQPGAMPIQLKVGDQVRNLPVSLRDRDFPVQRIRLSPSRAGLERTAYEDQRVETFKQLVTPEKLWNGPFARPSNGEISAVYGVRRYYNGVFAQDYYHRGVDYAAGTGSPIFAPAPGRVVLVGREADGFVVHGNTIGVDHGQGVLSIFIHLSRIDVQEGDFVQPGQQLGAIGSTGVATGPHLHWGLYVSGASVDPVPWRYDGIE